MAATNRRKTALEICWHFSLAATDDDAAAQVLDYLWPM